MLAHGNVIKGGMEEDGKGRKEWREKEPLILYVLHKLLHDAAAYT